MHHLAKTRYQLSVSATVGIFTAAVAQWGPSVGPGIRITQPDALGFFSMLSQALAAVIGLLVAVLTFALQRGEQAISGSYRSFQAELRTLDALIEDPAVPRHSASDRLDELAGELHSLDRPALRTGAREVLVAADEILRELMEGTSEAAPLERSRSYQVQASLGIIIDVLHSIPQQEAFLAGARALAGDTIRLLGLLGVSLVLFLVYSAWRLPAAYPPVGAGIIVGFLAMALLVLGGLARVIRDHFGSATLG